MQSLPRVHFRTRKNVIQFVRTIYNPVAKKPKAVVIGSIPVENPEIPSELMTKLSPAELAEAETWLKHRHRAMSLREELAALTLAETLELANRWFTREGTSENAHAAAAGLLPALQALRKTLNSNNLLA